MPVVWPTLLDFSRDECKRILRKLELEAYAGVISALRAQGDLSKEKKDLLGELSKVLSISTERHRAEVRRAVNDERLTTIAHNMSGPNSSSEWSIEGRRLIPLMPRLVPQTAFTAAANAIANSAGQHNSSLPDPAETGNKEVVVCYSYTSTTSTPTSTPVPSGSVATVKSPRPASPASNVVVLPSGSTVYVKSVNCSDDDEKPRKRRRTNSSSSSPVVLKDVPKPATPVSKTITVPVTGSPKMSIMQSIANSLPPHMSPVKITFSKPATQTTNTSTQKVIIVTTSPSSTFVPNILSKSHNYAAVTKLVPTSVITSTTQKPAVVATAAHYSALTTSSSGGTSTAVSAGSIAVTTVVSSTPSLVMSTMAQGKARPVASTTTTVGAGDVPLASLLQVSHPTQHHQLQTSQSSRALLQHVSQSQSAAQTSVVVKSLPMSSSGAITHIMHQALSSHTAFKRTEETVTEEGEVEEMDTLDPQTGLFYRSALAQRQQKQIHLHQEGAHLQVKTVQSLQTKQKQIIQLQPEQIQHKIHQTAQLSIRQQKITPLQQEHLQQRHMLVKERHIPSLLSQPQQTVVQVLAVKTTQQLPKLQQIPGQQKIYMQSQLSQTPIHIPVSEKQPTSQPLVTQGSSVTKITFEGHQPPTVSKATLSECLPKLTPAMTSIVPSMSMTDKTVADILKMSMLEADIDPNIEPMILDTPIKVTPLIKPMPVLTEAAIPPQVQRLCIPSSVTSAVPPLPKCFPAPIITATSSTALPVPLPPPPPLTRKVDVPVASQIIQIQNVPQPPKRVEEMPSEIIIQTIPQYPIPCHSSSNVVVEPSGLLEMNNFTSQRLGDEDTVIIHDDITDERTQCKPSLNIEHA
ncbi:unnamed protein product [Ranitomeya imitator]|uniref:ENT domain-containing protein n=1 Tax=Ranitomeya imitator TaxID=111125 RepID=A0ABN9M580_9NEOB|nr:unnamed protein product [Ranitomeya imitator]